MSQANLCYRRGPLVVRTLVRQPCAAPVRRVFPFHILEDYGLERRLGSFQNAYQSPYRPEAPAGSPL